MGWTSRLKSSREAARAVRTELRLTANPITSARMIAAATVHRAGRVVFESTRRIGFAMNTGRTNTLRRFPLLALERYQLKGVLPIPKYLYFYEHCQYRSRRRRPRSTAYHAVPAIGPRIGQNPPTGSPALHMAAGMEGRLQVDSAHRRVFDGEVDALFNFVLLDSTFKCRV